MKYIITFATWLIFFSTSANATQTKTTQTQTTDPVTGAITWDTKAHGVHFSLTQILPEQLRAFYDNRGFSLEQIKPFTTSCVYMTVLRNDTAPGEIHFIRSNWTVLVDNKPHKIVSVEQWVTKLKHIGATKPAIIAFRWAQFPPEQSYEPGGNWNQGMYSIGLPPGKSFDVIAKWDISGKEYQAKLSGVQCAK